MIAIIFLTLLIVFIIGEMYLRKAKVESFRTKDRTLIFKVERPFVNVFDNKGNQLNVTLLSRPFYDKVHYEKYEKIKDIFFILGISSYQEFPNMPMNPKDNYNTSTNTYNYIEWVNMCDGWLHCFRDKDKYLPKTMNSLLLSESDFIDCQINKPDPTIEKKYDFIYICHRDDTNDCSKDEWVAFNKNLGLAEQCFDILCGKLNMKGLLIGRAGCKIPDNLKNNLDVTPKLDYHTMNKKYDEAKFIFLPNVNDASPRVLTEALCHNIPCLVNENIVGGWKYVNDKTGVFFNGIDDIEEKATLLSSNLGTYEPRKNFIENYGVINSGKNLKQFVYEIYGDQINIPESEVLYLTPEFEKKDYEQCRA